MSTDSTSISSAHTGQTLQMETPMNTQARIVDDTNKYLIPNYGRLPVALVRGEGSRFWDANGKEYLDLFVGFGFGGVCGHCHPKITEAIVNQARTLTSTGNLFTNPRQVEMAKAITTHGFGGKVFFCHSGAEANEAALKLARLAAGEGRYKIISFNNCFHGRTMGALSLTPEKFQKGFEPMLPGNIKVPYGDLDAVAKAIDNETAAVILEPIQGEGGMNLPTREFMQGLRKLCTEQGIMMICDEVWTAPGRTGKWFAHQLFDIVPDVMTLGKSIGGGLPLAACVAAPKWQDILSPGTHGCTGGGNPLCTAAGAAAMRLIEQEDLLERAVTIGTRIIETISRSGCNIVKEVRGSGVMLGVQLNTPGKPVFDCCLERGLYINCTQDTVLRLAPAMTISDDELCKALEILVGVLKEQ